jgi:hypothetical protein
MMIPEIEADLVAIARDEALLFQKWMCQVLQPRSRASLSLQARFQISG